MPGSAGSGDPHPREPGQEGNSPQTRFWEGAFGDGYTVRNVVSVADRQPFFATILERTEGVQRVCELGANRGHNLQALAAVRPGLALTGVDVNRRAVEEMSALPGVDAQCASLQEYRPPVPFDLVFVCGVLIHLAPDDLPVAYQRLFDASRRYVLLNEYYHPTPVELDYRGQAGKLFKRDFGGEFWDAFPDRVRLIDFGFLWKRCHPAWDNTTWWLFEKIPTTGT